jgi:hypothetical protein
MEVNSYVLKWFKSYAQGVFAQREMVRRLQLGPRGRTQTLGDMTVDCAAVRTSMSSPATTSNDSSSSRYALPPSLPVLPALRPYAPAGPACEWYFIHWWPSWCCERREVTKVTSSASWRRPEELGVVWFEAGAYYVFDLLAVAASASLLRLRSSDSDRKISETLPHCCLEFHLNKLYLSPIINLLWHLQFNNFGLNWWKCNWRPSA